MGGHREGRSAARSPDAQDSLRAWGRAGQACATGSLTPRAQEPWRPSARGPLVLTGTPRAAPVLPFPEPRPCFLLSLARTEGASPSLHAHPAPLWLG